MSVFPAAAIATLTASGWQLWLAEWFGRRIEERDGDDVIVCYRWRGKLYMTDFYKAPRS